MVCFILSIYPLKTLTKYFLIFGGKGVNRVLTIPCLFAKVRESVTVIKLKKKFHG